MPGKWKIKKQREDAAQNDKNHENKSLMGPQDSPVPPSPHPHSNFIEEGTRVGAKTFAFIKKIFGKIFFRTLISQDIEVLEFS